jgi:hypothetical protein
MTVQPKNKTPFFSSIGENPYILINLILVGTILCIFFYSAIFSPQKNNYPIFSVHDYLTGQNSISTGLSRGFSSIMRGHFNDALDFNRYSIRLFSFFFIQLIMRCIAIFLTWNKKKQFTKYINLSDVFLSIGMFVYFFFPFIVDAL